MYVYNFLIQATLVMDLLETALTPIRVLQHVTMTMDRNVTKHQRSVNVQLVIFLHWIKKLVWIFMSVRIAIYVLHLPI